MMAGWQRARSNGKRTATAARQPDAHTVNENIENMKTLDVEMKTMKTIKSQDNVWHLARIYRMLQNIFNLKINLIKIKILKEKYLYCGDILDNLK